jgi:flagellar hook-associated protein 3 FlgL
VTTRITQNMLSSHLLSDLNDITTRLSKTQEQLSSGKSITQPSDNPFGTGQALQLRDDLARNGQLQSNVNDANAWQSAADSALSSINDALQRVSSLVVQGASDTTGQQGRNDIANEITQLIDTVKEAGNTQYAGRYIFAGSATSSPPYQMGASDAYAGNTEVLQHEIGPGVSVDISQPGSAVIGDSSGGLLATLRTVVSDLTSGNTNALTADLQKLQTSQDTVSNAQSMVGATENRLDTALSRLKQLQETWTASLSNTEDVDMAQATVDYSTEQSVYQSALRAGASLIQPSLMDFLSTT